MGHIIHLYDREETLGPELQDMMYIDIQENIHLHYRDLRVEMSLEEFEEFYNNLVQNGKDCLEHIKKSRWKDGKHQNTYTQEGYKMFSKNWKLKNRTKYFPNRVSIEKNNNVNHIHIRNCRIQCDDNTLNNITAALGNTRTNQPKELDKHRLLELLRTNDISYSYTKNGDTLDLHHLPIFTEKISTILTSLGFGLNDEIYAKNELKIRLNPIDDQKKILEKTINVNGKIYNVIRSFYKTCGRNPRYIDEKDMNGYKGNDIRSGRRYHVVNRDNKEYFIKEYVHLRGPSPMFAWCGIAKKESTKDEYQFIRSLKHKNAIEAYDYDKHHIVMEYIPHNVGELKLDNNDQNFIFSEVKDFCDYYKRKFGKSINLNLDVQNILYDRDNKKVKIIDFELYKPYDSDVSIDAQLPLVQEGLGKYVGRIKPDKIVYPMAVQVKYFERVVKRLLEHADNPAIEEIYMYGSLAYGNFGQYKVPWTNLRYMEYGSDVEIFIIANKDHPMPKEWKRLGVGKSNCVSFFLEDMPLYFKKGLPKDYEHQHHPADIYVHFKGDWSTKEIIDKFDTTPVVQIYSKTGKFSIQYPSSKNLKQFAETTKVPMVTIMMPAYNRAKYIAEAIESIQKQSYPHWELIIVDDGSTDGTERVVKRYLKDDRIVFFKNKENLGIAKSRNIALNNAKGIYVGHLDSDDILHREALEKCLRIFGAKPEIKMVYTNFEQVNENNTKQLCITKGHTFDRKMLYKNYIWSAFGIYEKAAAISIGGFDDSLKTCEDGLLYLKMGELFDLFHLDETLYTRRVHPQNSYTLFIPRGCNGCSRNGHCPNHVQIARLKRLSKGL
ncbi:MAG: glycosyltransferase [Nanoarchaeota archaeon]|nr:glycosyltransferase [Nanoarchaeota archaeon]MBU1704390.1 glycosyltransferase [Nanoarchaeota archaeon]